VTIDGTGMLGRRIASVFAAGGAEVRIFDLAAERRTAARDYAAAHAEQVKHTLDLDSQGSRLATAA
jgi:3-hydroxybutyryl-CoA dehydrogenase